MKKIVGIAFMFAIPTLAVACLPVLRRYTAYAGASLDLTAWAAFFTVFGVLYAIIVGFLLIDLLRRFSTLSGTMEDELNAVEGIRDLLPTVSGQAAAPPDVVHALHAYLRSVAGREWEAMASSGRGAVRLDSDTSPELAMVLERVRAITATDDRARVALHHFWDHATALAALRTRRIHLAAERLPFYLWMLVAFTSAVLIGGVLCMRVEHPVVHAGMVFAVTVTVVIIGAILTDLNHPFFGTWNIPKESVESLAAKLERNASAT
jgi:hypothetical protein